MVYVIATLELAPGKRSAFLAEFAKVVPLVHAEQGCIEYVPAIDAETDIPSQHRMGPDRAGRPGRPRVAGALDRDGALRGELGRRA